MYHVVTWTLGRIIIALPHQGENLLSGLRAKRMQAQKAQGASRKSLATPGPLPRLFRAHHSPSETKAGKTKQVALEHPTATLTEKIRIFLSQGNQWLCFHNWTLLGSSSSSVSVVCFCVYCFFFFFFYCWCC